MPEPEANRGSGSDSGSDSSSSPNTSSSSDSKPGSTSDRDPVERWQARLEETGELTPELVGTITRLHGDRGVRAIEAVGEGRVKVYRDFTVVVGYEDEYVVEGRGCTCKDSEYNLDSDDPTQLCWHVLAVAIGRRVGHVDYHDMWYSEVRDFV